MDAGQMVLGTIVFGAAAWGCRALFFGEKEYDELEQAFLSLAMAFFAPLSALIFLNMALQLPTGQVANMAVFAALAAAPVALKKAGWLKEDGKEPTAHKWQEKRHAEPQFLKEWTVQYAFVALAIASFLLLATPYFAKNTMWMDEGMDENLAGHLANGALFQNLDYMHRNPVSPFGLAAFYSLFGKGAEVVYGYNFFLAIISIGLVYVLTRRVFGIIEAMAAAGLLAFNRLFVFYSLRYLTEISQIVAVALFAFFFFQVFKEKKSEKMALLAFSAGVLFVAKYTLAALFVAAAVVVALFYRQEVVELAKKDGKRAAVAAAVAVLVVAPIFAFNYVKTGSPVGILLGFLGGMTEAGGSPWYEFVAISPHVFTSVWVVALVLLGILLALWHGDKSALEASVLFVVAFAVTSKVITLQADRYIMFLYPLAFLLAGYAAYWAAFGAAKISAGDPLTSLWKAGFAIFCLLALFSGTVGAVQDTKALVDGKLASYRELQFAGKAAQGVSAPGDVIASSSGPELGFYAQRETIFIPHNLTELRRVFAEKNVRVAVLTVFEEQAKYQQALQDLNQNRTGTPANDFEYFFWGNEWEPVQVVPNEQGFPMAVVFKKK